MLEKEKRVACPMRHENGNCMPAGGFCTAVNDCICEALHNAFNSGIAALANELIRQRKEAPAEDVEKVERMQWIKKPHVSKDYKQCPVCKYDFSRLEPDNFCPNCGAKKEG